MKVQSPSLRGSGRFSAGDLERRPGPGPVQSPSLRGSGRFSRRTPTGRNNSSRSIPFIAGQWSLLVDQAARHEAGGGCSIPFIAGQWSLLGTLRPTGEVTILFNPLHCGAVVASPLIKRLRHILESEVQSPSLRGSGRFSDSREFVGISQCVSSIPFIAGQWSLLLMLTRS